MALNGKINKIKDTLGLYRHKKIAINGHELDGLDYVCGGLVDTKFS